MRRDTLRTIAVLTLAAAFIAATEFLPTLLAQGAVCNGRNCRPIPANASVIYLQPGEKVINPPPGLVIRYGPAPAPAAPIAGPAAPAAQGPKAPYVPPGRVFPTGVVGEKLSTNPRYGLSGQDISQEGAYQALGAQGLIDDRNKPYVAVIDADAARRKSVVDALKANLGDKVKIWDGPPNDWSFETGHKTDGNPTIYCQFPDGGVKHRQDDISDGVDVAIGSVRKAFPEYNPAKDPDLRKPQLPGGNLFNFDLANGKNQIAIILALVAGGVFFYLRGKQPAAAAK